MEYGVVYQVTNTVTKERYIGATSNFQVRKKNHRNRHGINKQLMTAYERYGDAAFDWSILARCDSKRELFECEAELIEINQPEYNGQHAGHGARPQDWAAKRWKNATDKDHKKLSKKIQMKYADDNWVESWRTRMRESVWDNAEVRATLQKTTADGWKDPEIRARRTEGIRRTRGSKVRATLPDGMVLEFETMNDCAKHFAYSRSKIWHRIKNGPATKGRVVGINFEYIEEM